MINQQNQEVVRVDELRCSDICVEFDFPNKVILGAGTYGQQYLSFQEKFIKLRINWMINFMPQNVQNCKMKRREQHIHLLKFPITSLREIKFLTALDQENVIKIKQIYTRVKKNKNKIKQIKTYCAMDLMAYDFLHIIKQNYDTKFYFTTNQIRSILYQCFKGLQYIHSQKIIHRDIKSANILVNEEGIVKIADFGLAKFCPKNEGIRKTPTVVTLSYRAPEVLLTRGQYSFQIDVWSMGQRNSLFRCIALELSFNRPVFQAKDEAQQIQQIMERCGTPTQETWPEILKSDYFIKFNPQKYERKFISSIRSQNMNFDDDLLDLLDKIFVLNPNVRLSVEQVLKHPFFTNHNLDQCYKEFKEYITKRNMNSGKAVVYVQKPVMQKTVNFVL